MPEYDLKRFYREVENNPALFERLMNCLPKNMRVAYESGCAPMLLKTLYVYMCCEDARLLLEKKLIAFSACEHTPAPALRLSELLRQYGYNVCPEDLLGLDAPESEDMTSVEGL